MHVRTRRSALKARKMKGFRRKMKRKAGRQIVNRQRNRGLGKAKHNKSRRGKDRQKNMKIFGRS